MRKLLALLCLLALLPLQADALTGSRRVLLFGAKQTPTFFIATSGSDANIGTQQKPWQSISKVNSSAPVGSIVKFNGGDTFSTTTGITADVSVAPYGTGQPTITSGNSAPCVTNTNPAGSRSVTNIICTGGGNGTSTTAGISFANSQAGNTKLAGPTITGNIVSGYGGNGIEILGTNGTSGFSGVIVSRNTIHDVTGTSTNSFGSAALMIASSTGYGFGVTAPAHLNITVQNNTIFNVPGATAASINWTGSGMYIAQCGGTVTLGGSPGTGNLIHDFGNQNGSTFEPAGILFADFGVTVGQGIVSFNEIYRGFAGTNASPSLADGIVIDGGAVGSITEHNKIHDNAGLGILFENYTDAALLTWGNNTARWNILQNNASTAFVRTAEILLHFPRSATGPGYVYQNTIVNQNGGNAFGDSSDSTGTYTVTVANNIVAVNNNGNLAHFIHPPAGLQFAGNDYWTYGQPVNFSWGGTAYTSFAAWQTATGQEKIAGSNVGLTVNPQIYVPGGLFTTGGYFPSQDMGNNLQVGSPMIGAGLNLTTQFGINPGTSDYYGTAISAVSLPVGAATGDFSSFASSCAASTNFLARVSSFTKLDSVNYNSLLCSGYFANFDLLYVTAAPNSIAAGLNLLAATFPLTVNGGCTFTARTGYTGNGTNCFLDSGWKAATNSVNYTLSSVTHFGYTLIDGIINTKASYGTQNVAVTAETSNFPGIGGWYSDANDETGTVSTGTTVSKGMFLLDRNSSTNLLTEFLDGLQVHQSVAGVPPVALPDQSMYLLAFNNSGAASLFSANTLSAVGFGAGSQNDAAIATQINSFMMAYGINIY